MNPLAARVLQQGVDFTYGQFLKLVSKGRKSTPEAIDQIAQGRVWTGAHAHRLGLVDHLGELDDAIGAAARLAKIEKYEPDYIEPELGPWETLLQDFSASSLLPPATQHLLTKLATTLARLPALRAISELQLFNDPNHLYVRCWECRSPIR
jgi:protease-4